jgi:hypothetical protein
MSDEILSGAANMMGLGIMTMGAMVPLIILKNVAENGGTTIGKSGKGIKTNALKMNVDFKMPKINVKKIRVK